MYANNLIGYNMDIVFILEAIVIFHIRYTKKFLLYIYI